MGFQIEGGRRSKNNEQMQCTEETKLIIVYMLLDYLIYYHFKHYDFGD